MSKNGGLKMENDEIEILKKDISLVDFITSFGGVINNKKSSKKSALIDIHDTKLIVTRKENEHYVYCDLNNPKNNGSIIDFYMNNVNKNASFKDTIFAIKNFCENGYVVTKKLNICSKNDVCDSLQFIKNIDKNDLKNINETRKIDIKILREFEDIIFKDNNNNFCFPHKKYFFNDNKFTFELCGYEVKNEGFKGQKGGKGLWGKRVGFSQDIYLFESSFDAMAFFELHKKEGFYISVGGAFSKTQIEYLKAVIINSKSQNLGVCFDNDKAGNVMFENIISELQFLNINIKKITSILKDFNQDLINLKNSSNS